MSSYLSSKALRQNTTEDRMVRFGPDFLSIVAVAVLEGFYEQSAGNTNFFNSSDDTLDNNRTHNCMTKINTGG